jgi:phage terminase large subunit GpA-like protein
MYQIAQLTTEMMELLRPPPKLTLSEWTEKNFVLPAGTAKPGRFRLWPFQREIIDAMGDPLIERVTVVKSTRVGYTKSLMAAIGATAANDPCPMILLVPTDDDARDIAATEVEPAFAQTPALRGLLGAGRLDGRNTLTVKTLAGGGSIKLLAAKSPRNLRRHDAKKLFIDEEDAMEVTPEGDPIDLAEKRTLSHPDRKIIRGSTPTNELTSTIHRAYLESDQRIFECPCPHCGSFFELLWEHIVWPTGEPKQAKCACPHCSELIDERFKNQMVALGAERGWRRCEPEVMGHAGFRLNALISPLAHVRWGILATEFLRAKRAGPAAMQVFVNASLGRVWRMSIDDIEPENLQARVEPFGLKGVFPAEAFGITAGVDTQPDRFEVSIWGWNETQAFALGHFVVWGSPNDDITQRELDMLLHSRWKHPNGWDIRIDAVAIDSAGHNTQAVYDFCAARFSRRVFAIVGRAGARKIWEASKRKQKTGVRLFLVGVEQIKTDILQRLALPTTNKHGKPVPHSIRISNEMPEDWFDQILGERRLVRYVHNRAVVEFRPRKMGQRVEAFDCAVYAFAVLHGIRIDYAERRKRLGVSPVNEQTRAARLAKLLPS